MNNNLKLPTICIVGRTNVGKSTLFNAIVGTRKAVVRDSPGVTRDRCYEMVTRFSFPFTLVDTGALVGEETMALHDSVQQQTALAIRESEVIIAVFDGLHGLHPLDWQVVDFVRQSGKPVIWVVNKCEKPDTELLAGELYALGIDDLVFVTAAHRRGIRDILAKIRALLGISGEEEPVEADVEIEEINDDVPERPERPDRPIRFAIVGKPNVGKSTLVNRILGEDRMITSPLAGTTRDSISSFVVRDGQRYEVVDTAGLRRKAKVSDDTVERYSNIRTLRSLAEADVAVFLLDATEVPTEQDAKILGLVHEKGRGLIIVVNKWDLIEKDSKMAESYRTAIRQIFKFAQYAPVIFVSALTGKRCPNLLDEVRKVYETSKIKIPTSELNRILGVAFERRPPPVYHGAPVRMLYATQIATQPPTIAIFVSYPEKLNFSYQRYIKNYVREHYPFEGVDIRLVFRRRSQAKAAA